MFKNTEIGIDLGTANTLVYTKDKGIIFNEPSVVAIDLLTKQVVAVGTDAKEMIGKTPEHIMTIRPLKDGVIADFDITTQMLKHILKKATKSMQSIIRKPTVVVSTLSGSTSVEKKAIQEAIKNCGAKHVHLIDEPVAAALGADLPVDEPTANVIVNIGGGTTEVAIISYGGIVSSHSIRIGGDQFDEDIIQYVRKKYNLLIGERTAEQIKIKIGYAPIEHPPVSLEVRGRDLVTGLPKTFTIVSTEIQQAISESLQHIFNTIRLTLEESPPELSGDIVDRGIVLTGGGALLNGMHEWLSQEMIVPVRLADQPLEAVAIGTGESLQVINKLQKTLY